MPPTPNLSSEANGDPPVVFGAGRAARALRLAGGWALGAYVVLLVVIDWRLGSVLSKFDPLGLPMVGVRCFAGAGLLTLLVVAAWPRRRTASLRGRVLAGMATSGACVVAWVVWDGWETKRLDYWLVLVGWAAVLWVGTVIASRQAGPWAVVVWGARVGAALALAVFLSKSIEGQQQIAPFWYYWPHLEVGGKIDKSLHFYAAYVLTLLCLLAEPLGTRRPWLGATITLVLLLLVQPVLEKIQVGLGRSDEWLDVAGHSIGVLAALVTYALIRCLRHAVRPTRTREGAQDAA